MNTRFRRKQIFLFGVFVGLMLSVLFTPDGNKPSPIKTTPSSQSNERIIDQEIFHPPGRSFVVA